MLPSSAAWRPWSASSSLAALRRVADAPGLAAVRESLPWSLIGLAAGLIAFVAIVPVHRPFFAGLMQRISLAELPAFAIMGVTLAVVLAYRLSVRLDLNPPIVISATLGAFLLALPQPVQWSDPLTYLHRAGESGLLQAIAVALLVAGACRLARCFLRAPLAADTAGAVAVLAIAAALFGAHLSLGNLVIAALKPLGNLGDTYAALVIITLLQTLLWICGIHGPATLAAVVTPVYLTLQLQNTAAYAHHEALPHIVVVSLFLFVFPGGAGATLPLAALLCLSKVRRLRSVGRLTIGPALFNINDPLVFGLPIVFNPFLAVPFVGVPVVLATISYLAIAHGLVARPAQYVPSSIPTFASTYLATLDARAVVLVAINIAIATLLYIPFVRAYERHELRNGA